MTLTDFLAVWGAVLSTGAIVWNIIRDLRDVADIRVSAKVVRPVRHNTTPPRTAWMTAVEGEEASHILFTVTNCGRRAALIEKICVKHKDHKGTGVVIPRELPKLLNENQTVHEYVDDLSIAKEPIERVFVVDSLEREWQMKRQQMKALKEQLRRLKIGQ